MYKMFKMYKMNEYSPSKIWLKDSHTQLSYIIFNVIESLKIELGFESAK